MLFSYLSTRLHSVISNKTIIVMFTAMRTTEFICLNWKFIYNSVPCSLCYGYGLGHRLFSSFPYPARFLDLRSLLFK